MPTYSNQSKQSASAFTNSSKASSVIKNQVKPGQGYAYDLDYMSYDEDVDPISGSDVYYDGIGTEPTYVNLAKS